MLLSPEPTGNGKIYLALIFRKQSQSVGFWLVFASAQAGILPRAQNQVRAQRPTR